MKVACAIIEEHGKILLVRRSSSMNLPGKWELPGGKIETHESSSECIHREILEELGIKLNIVEILPASVTGEIELIPFRSVISGGFLKLAEHDSFQWIDPGKYQEFDLSPADRPVLKYYCMHHCGITDIQ